MSLVVHEVVEDRVLLAINLNVTIVEALYSASLVEFGSSGNPARESEVGNEVFGPFPPAAVLKLLEVVELVPAVIEAYIISMA